MAEGLGEEAHVVEADPADAADHEVDKEGDKDGHAYGP